MLRDMARLKCIIIKHIWVLWPGRLQDIATTMALAANAFATCRKCGFVDLELAKALDMQQQCWSLMLHLLVRLAIWMDAPLLGTPLHTAFMGRMDMLFKELHATYCVSARERKKVFSDFIEDIRSKPAEWNSWLHIADARVLSTSTFIEMQRIWLLGRRGVHLAYVQHLPKNLQGALLLMALFFKATRCKTPTSKQKLRECALVLVRQCFS